MEETSGGHSLNNLVYATGVATVAFGSALLYAVSKSKSKPNVVEEETKKVPKIDKTKYPGGLIRVFFGSQTGTSESFCKIIQREGESNGFLIEVIDLEDIEEDVYNGLLSNEYDDEDESVQKAAFIVATYGEGEPTDNATAFATFLKRTTGLPVVDDGSSSGGVVAADNDGEEKKSDAVDDIDDDGASNRLSVEQRRDFAKLEYSVFGLGDTQYEHYCAMGKYVDRALHAAGATRVMRMGMGNDQKDIEEDFEKWKDEVFWPGMKRRYLKEGAVPKSKPKKKTPVCNYAIDYLDPNEHKTYTQSQSQSEPDSVTLTSKPYFSSHSVPLTTRRELRNTSLDSGSTLHLEFDLSSSTAIPSPTYQTADNLGVLPVNPPSVVESVATSLGYDLDAVFTLRSSRDDRPYDNPFPTPCTVRECLSRYCDLNGPLRRSDLKLLAQYCTDPTSRSALLRMSSKDGKAEYRQKITAEKVGVADILTSLCRDIEMPLEHFVQVCPRLLPRYYTISSSSKVFPRTVHATVSVLEEEKESGTKDNTGFKGVCSNYLKNVEEGESVNLFVRESAFRLPSDTTKPIIMIGPGTGIAPMRALLQERAHQKNTLSLPVGSNTLYFGCKKRTLDFLYSTELEEYQTSGVLDDLYLAFSREQDEKVYVQHLLKKNGKVTWDLINDSGAYVYVCGGVRMGADVGDALRGIASEYGVKTAEEAKEFMDKMAREGRYVQELWA